MAFLRNAALSLAALGFVAIAPLTAQAIEVECELKDGSACTVSNDPSDFSSCLCEDESGTAGSGGDDWADFDEEQLLEICLSELSLCESMDTDGGTEGMTSTTGATTVDPTGAMDTGDDSTGGGSSTGGESSTSGTTGEGSSSTGDKPGGSGPSTNPSDTDSGGTASGGDSGPATTTGPAPGGDEGGDDGSSGGAEADNEDPSGCSVDARGRSGGLLFAMFGLVLGLRRRRAV